MTSAATEAQLREETQQWVLPLVGREVDQLCIDFAVTLVVEGSDTVRLATPFTLEVDGQVHTVDPEQTETLLPVLGLHRAVVMAAQAGKDGILQLRFDGDRVLRSEPDDDYEAWEVGGGLPPVTSSYHILAKAGGGVAVI
ncbi:MAG: DUF6188 family protein [Dermatophilaceae bacterium]